MYSCAVSVESSRTVVDQVQERPYMSFLIRCWSLSQGKRRIKVEHIQTGEWAGVATLAEAAAWIDERCARQTEDCRSGEEA